MTAYVEDGGSIEGGNTKKSNRRCATFGRAVKVILPRPALDGGTARSGRVAKLDYRCARDVRAASRGVAGEAYIALVRGADGCAARSGAVEEFRVTEVVHDGRAACTGSVEEFREGESPVEDVRVPRSGAVEEVYRSEVAEAIIDSPEVLCDPRIVRDAAAANSEREAGTSRDGIRIRRGRGKRDPVDLRIRGDGDMRGFGKSESRRICRSIRDSRGRPVGSRIPVARAGVRVPYRGSMER